MHLQGSLLRLLRAHGRRIRFLGVNLGGHFPRARPAEEGDEGEQAGETVESQAHQELLDLMHPGLVLLHVVMVPTCRTRVPWMPVPVDLSALPRDQLFPVPGGVQGHRQRGGRERGHESHDDEDGERPLAEDLGVVADVLRKSAVHPNTPVVTRTNTISSTSPLQLISTPTVKLSRQINLQSLAAMVPPISLPKKATAMTPKT